jgi:hypothetical protein
MSLTDDTRESVVMMHRLEFRLWMMRLKTTGSV